MEVSLVEGKTEHIPELIKLAHETWWGTYSNIISREQIQYMLDTLFNPKILETSMQQGLQHFILVKEGQRSVAFASYGKIDEDFSSLKIFKLYVSPLSQGKGYGRLLINVIKEKGMEVGVNHLILNVNRYNKAKEFYRRIGFQILREEDLPIGPYWMNDYVMSMPIKSED